MKKSVLAAVGFVLVLALRSPFCGMDVTGISNGISSMSYAGVFYRITNYSIWDILFNSEIVHGHMEVGWLLLTKIISLFTKDLQVFLFIVALIQFIPIIYVISKYSKNVILSYFIFACLGFYFRYFSGLRQALAISIILLAFDQLYQKRYFWFVAITIIASFIHRSAVFFLIIWPLSYINITATTFVITIIVIIALMPFYQMIVPWILDVFFRSEYEHYIDNKGQAITMFVVYAIFLLLSLLNKKRDSLIDLLRILVLVGVVGQSLGILSAGAITRIGYYFNFFLIFLLPEVVDSFKDRAERSTINVIAVVLLSIFFVLSQPAGPGSANVIPYYFYWENPVLY